MNNTEYSVFIFPNWYTLKMWLCDHNLKLGHISLKCNLLGEKDGLYMLVLLASLKWLWCPGEYLLVSYSMIFCMEPEYIRHDISATWEKLIKPTYRAHLFHQVSCTLISSGSAFHSLGPATENDSSDTNINLVNGTTRSTPDPDRRALWSVDLKQVTQIGWGKTVDAIEYLKFNCRVSQCRYFKT